MNCDCPELLWAEFVMVRVFLCCFVSGWLSLVEPDCFFKADACLLRLKFTKCTITILTKK